MLAPSSGNTLTLPVASAVTNSLRQATSWFSRNSKHRSVQNPAGEYLVQPRQQPHRPGRILRCSRFWVKHIPIEDISTDDALLSPTLNVYGNLSTAEN